MSATRQGTIHTENQDPGLATIDCYLKFFRNLVRMPWGGDFRASSSSLAASHSSSMWACAARHVQRTVFPHIDDNNPALDTTNEEGTHPPTRNVDSLSLKGSPQLLPGKHHQGRAVHSPAYSSP